ncbi:MAG: hypothetical protein AAB418_03140 [candidate division NC10 bacterium]
MPRSFTDNTGIPHSHRTFVDLAMLVLLRRPNASRPWRHGEVSSGGTA